MPVNPELIVLYHEYLGLTKHPAAAASLVLLDVLGKGPQQVHFLLTGEDATQDVAPAEPVEPVEPVVTGITALTPSGVAENIADTVAAGEPIAQPDEWAKLLDAYKQLKKA